MTPNPRERAAWADDDDPPLLRLSEDQEVTLTGLLLRLMDDDIAALGAASGKTSLINIRRSRRDQLRFERSLKAEGRGHHDELEIEQLPTLEARLMAMADSPAHSLMLLVSAAAHQPYLKDMPAGTAGRLSSRPRYQRLVWAARHLGLGDRYLPRILDHLDPRRSATFARRAKQAAVLGGSVWLGVATAGMAAPAIGTAVGGAMGLSGAAATSAGLATIGGGSLAAGGAGMAGGTALIGALGGVGGAGIGTLVASGVSKGELAAQAQQLGALIVAGELADKGTRYLTRGVGARIEIEIGRLLAERARRQAHGDSALAVAREIAALKELRGALPMPHKFEL